MDETTRPNARLGGGGALDGVPGDGGNRGAGRPHPAMDDLYRAARLEAELQLAEAKLEAAEQDARAVARGGFLLAWLVFTLGVLIGLLVW